MKALVIEDSVRQPSTLDTSLQQSGYSIDRAFDGNAAIKRARERAYDLIILDLMLSQQSSLLVLHEIRELNPDVKILILSSRKQIRDRVTALIQGADDYLVKPISADDLLARIETLQNQRAAVQSSDGVDRGAADNCARLNQSIDNLLQLCRHEHDKFKLVFSEVKLSPLLSEVCANVSKAAASNEVVLQLPRCKLPSLLVDARWMRHLLVNLVTHAISRSPARAVICFEFQTDTSYGTLTIESPMSAPLRDEKLLQTLWNSDVDEKDDASLRSGASLSLAKICADGMNLRLNASIIGSNRLQFRLSNIRIA